jgi:hypothetical protein
MGTAELSRALTEEKVYLGVCNEVIRPTFQDRWNGVVERAGHGKVAGTVLLKAPEPPFDGPQEDHHAYDPSAQGGRCGTRLHPEG